MPSICPQSGMKKIKARLKKPKPSEMFKYPLQDLPEEILTKIASFLPPAEAAVYLVKQRIRGRDQISARPHESTVEQLRDLTSFAMTCRAAANSARQLSSGPYEVTIRLDATETVQREKVDMIKNERMARWFRSCRTVTIVDLFGVRLRPGMVSFPVSWHFVDISVRMDIDLPTAKQLFVKYMTDEVQRFYHSGRFPGIAAYYTSTEMQQALDFLRHVKRKSGRLPLPQDIYDAFCVGVLQDQPSSSPLASVTTRREAFEQYNHDIRLKTERSYRYRHKIMFWCRLLFNR